MTNGAALHFTSATTANTGGTYTYNVNGVLDMSASAGASNLVPNSFNASSLVKLNVAGVMKVGAGFNTVPSGTGTTPGAVSLNVLSGGTVDVSATSSLTCGTLAFIMADGNCNNETGSCCR